MRIHLSYPFKLSCLRIIPYRIQPIIVFLPREGLTEEPLSSLKLSNPSIKFGVL